MNIELFIIVPELLIASENRSIELTTLEKLKTQKVPERTINTTQYN